MNELTRPEGFEKLPRRFSDYIIQLEQRVAALKSLTPNDVPKQGARLELSKGGAERVYLPDDSVLGFYVGTRDPITVKRSRHRDGAIEVSGTMESIVVYPTVSNVVEVAYDPDRVRRG